MKNLSTTPKETNLNMLEGKKKKKKVKSSSWYLLYELESFITSVLDQYGLKS